MIPDLAEATITLTNNTQLQVKLYDIAGRLIDTAGDGIGKPMPGDIAQKDRGPGLGGGLVRMGINLPLADLAVNYGVFMVI